MLHFVIQKIRNKKWMVISLLLGNLLLIATAAASPMYTQAVLQRVFQKELNDYLIDTNRYPGTMLLKGGISVMGEISEETGDPIGNELKAITQKLGVSAMETAVRYQMDTLYIKPVSSDIIKTDNLMVSLSSFPELEEHIEVTHGRMFSDQLDGENTFDVMVSERTFVERDLVLNEVYQFDKLANEQGEPYRIRIAGIFKNKEEQDPYWLQSPNYFNNILVMDSDLHKELFFFGARTKDKVNATWHTVLDYTQMRADQAEEMLDVLQSYQNAIEEKRVVSQVYFEDILTNYVQEAQKLNTTILVLQIPVFVLLAVFVFMVSGQMLEMEQGEISVYKSRGASKWQIIKLYLLQSLLIAGVSLVLGIPLGVLICKLLGASSGFLEFVQRKALEVNLAPKVWAFAVTAALFSVATMVMPVIRYAAVGIVAYKRKKNKSNKRVWWKLACIDLILLGISLYGWYQFQRQQEFLSQQAAGGMALDPLLYFSSSLFMLGAGLLCLRILPWLVRCIFWIGKKWWPPALYASFLRILRANDNQGFLVVFLVLTVSMGIFSTQMARTINANEEDRIRYVIGADLVVQEKWSDTASTSEDEESGGSSSSATATYIEPDFGEYEELEGVRHVTKVLVDKKVRVAIDGGKLENVMVMGIHTKEFGQVAWMKDHLLAAHWYEYLNAISQNARAILVSSNFRDDYGYEIGDSLRFNNANGDSVRGVIYGFVDYWPSFVPVTVNRGSDGRYTEQENYLIVAHLSQLQASWGIVPYQLWIDTEDSSQFIYDYAQESGTQYAVFEDMAAQVIELKNDPIFQGTNGVLTIGFIIVLMLCMAGFLIYWILSIQSRTLQFGIFRAMGMSKGEVLSMLVNEQIFISGVAIASGVLVGILSSRLYVPLIQVAYSASNQVIPLEIISEGSDYVRLGIVIGIMLILCMVVLGMLISRIKISQALKLGED